MQGRSDDLLDVLNLSLGLLGEIAVTSYDDPDTEAGKKAKRFIEFTIDEVQRDYIFQELITVDTLSSAGESYHYAIPDDCLRPMGIRLSSYGDPDLHPLLQATGSTYQVEGNEIITTSSNPELLYIKRNDDPTKWSSELEQLIVLKLAVNAGYLITDNTQLIQMLEAKYENLALPKAKQLQSKYKRKPAKYMPTGFENLLARLG